MTVSREGKGIDEFFDTLSDDVVSFAMARLWENTDIQESGCWEWESHTTKSGYGYMSVDGEKFYVHRLSAYFNAQKDISSKQVNHKCDNKKCLRPSHYYLGTAKENVQDIIERGDVKRERKLSDEEVEKIREMVKSGEKTQSEIAEEFGVCQTHVSKIKRGKRR